MSKEEVERIVLMAKSVLAGAPVVAILVLLVEFSWGVLHTDGDAKKMATEAVTKALAPVCVQDFIEHATSGEYKDFKTADDYERRRMIKKVVTYVPASEMTSALTTACSKGIAVAQDNTHKEIFVQ